MLEDARQRFELTSVSCCPDRKHSQLITHSSFASFTPSPFFLLSVTLSSTLRVYNFATSKVLKTLRAPGTYICDKHPCPAVVFGRNDAAGQNGHSIENGGRRKAQEAWVVSGSENGRAVIWDLGSRRVLQVLETEGLLHCPIVAVAVRHV